MVEANGVLPKFLRHLCSLLLTEASGMCMCCSVHELGVNGACTFDQLGCTCTVCCQLDKSAELGVNSAGMLPALSCLFTLLLFGQNYPEEGTEGACIPAHFTLSRAERPSLEQGACICAPLPFTQVTQAISCFMNAMPLSRTLQN